MSKSVEVVVISLVHATDRRQLISEQLTAFSLPWSFFDAHTSLVNPALKYDAARIRRAFGRTLSNGQLACWSSHYSVIQRFLNESTSDYLLVLEDDVIFDTAFPVHALVDFCEERGIHYIRLFGMYYADAVQLSYFYNRALIRYKSSPCGTQAYLLSKEGARRMVNCCEMVNATVDLIMDYFWNTKLPLYAIYPFPIIERFAASSIPILDGPGLSRTERTDYTLSRAHNRLLKILENRKLAAADREFQRKSLPFKQINAEDVSKG